MKPSYPLKRLKSKGSTLPSSPLRRTYIYKEHVIRDTFETSQIYENKGQTIG